jgi:hypothetical protein
MYGHKDVDFADMDGFDMRAGMMASKTTTRIRCGPLATAKQGAERRRTRCTSGTDNLCR